MFEEKKLSYNINDLIGNSVPEALGTPNFTAENTPSFGNTSTDAIAPETITSGEIQGNQTMTDGYLQSKNFVTGSAGWQLLPNGNFEGSNGNFRGDISGATGTFTGALTGATIKTAASGTRFEMTSTSFQGINSSGTVVFENIISGADAGDVIMGDDASTSYAKWDNSAGTFTVYGIGKFGGTGADGALAVSSGTTQIDCGGAGTFEKNYTSISITGTGKVEFINPASTGTVITIKSQGNVTLTSSTAPMLSAVGMGSNTTGLVTMGTGATVGGGAGGGSAGAAGACPTLRNGFNVAYLSKYFSYFAVGAKGGDGADTGAGDNNGVGGIGGGVMFLQVGGTFTFTTANGISVAGAPGTDGGAGNAVFNGGSGGAGGGGGVCFVLYQTAGTITGTVNASGGAGGAGGAPTSSLTNNNTHHGAGGGGGASIAGTGGISSTTVNGFTPNTAGAAGGAGFSILSINSEFL